MALPRPPSTINIGGRVYNNPFYSPPGTLIGTSPGVSSSGTPIVTPSQVRSGGGYSSGGSSGGGSSRPVIRTLQSDPSLGQSVADVVRSSNVNLAKVKQYISDVEANTGSSFADIIASQSSTDVGASALLSKIASKKMQERIDAEIKEPLEAYTSKAEQFEKDVEDFESSFSGRGLNPQEYAVAVQKQNELVARQKELEQEASRLDFATKVAQVKAQQEYQQKQERIKKQVDASTTMQELIRSGTGKQKTNIFFDYKKPIALASSLRKTSETITPEIIKVPLGGTYTITEDYERVGSDFSTEYKKIGDSSNKTFSLDELNKKASFNLESTAASASQAIITPVDFLLFTPLGKPVGQVISSATSFVAKPFIKISSRLTVPITKIPVVSKAILKAKNVLTPTIKFSKYGKIQETRIVTDTGKIIVSGKGTVISEQAGLIAKLKASITRQTLKFKEVRTPIEFSFDVTKNYALKGPLKIGKIQPVGSPFTLQNVIPEDRLVQLLKEQTTLIRGLKGRAGFDSQGIIKIGLKKDPFVVRELTDVFTKSPRVRVSPMGAEKSAFEQTLASFKFKLRTVGDTLSGGKVSGVQLSTDTTLLRQKIRVEAGPKFDVKSLVVKGKTPGTFDVGKVKVLGLKSMKKDLSINVVGDVIAKLKSSIKIPSVSKLPTGSVLARPVETGLKRQALEKTVSSIKTNLAKATRPLVRISPGLVSGVVEDVEVEQVIPSEFASSRISFSQSQPSLTLPSLASVSRVGEVSLVKTSDVAKIGVSSGISVDTGTRIIPKTIVAPKTIIAPKTIVGPKVATRLSTALKTRTLTRTKLLNVPRTTFVPRTPPVVPKIPIVPITGFLPKFGVASFGKKKTKLQELFDVEVRKKGKFVKIGSRLPKGLAKLTGKSFTDKTIARTFRLTPVGFGRAKDVALPKLDQYRLPKGRSSLRGPLTFVEKSKFAIDTPSEKSALKSARLKKVFDY